MQTDNFSIIHGYDGCSFQKHYINQDSGDRYPFFFFNFLSCVSVVNSLLMLLPLMVSAALSYQVLTSTDYSAIILNQVWCYLSFKLLLLFFLSLFPKLTITCIYNSFPFNQVS